MANPETARLGTDNAPGTYILRPGTLASAAVAVCLAQVALAIPAVLNGMFTTDLGPTSSQLTWITDAFLVPVCLLELTFGVLGDLFGRKRLLISGAVVLAVGEAIAVATPGAGSSTSTRVLVLWIGQIIAGVGAAALFPTSLAMIAAGTHTARRPGSVGLDLGGGAVVWRDDLKRARRPGLQGPFRQRPERRLAVGVRGGWRPWRWPARP